MELREIIHRDGDFHMSQQMAAALSNVTVQTMVAWDKSTDPPPRNSDGTYPAGPYGMWMMKRQTLRPGRGNSMPFMPDIESSGEETESKPLDARAESARLNKARADKVEMENEILAGTLVRAEDVEEGWLKIIQIIKTKLTKIPVSMAPVVIGDNDMYSIQVKLRDVVNDILNELSEDADNEKQ